ncbi:MAG: NAD(P)-dependent oxidoreductase [Salibacteraceae bacterium]
MRVLFIDSVHPILQKKFTEIHYKCTDGTQWTKDEIFDKIKDYDGVVIRSKFTIDKEFLKKANSLKFIARSGSGLENIDLVAAKEHQVEVFNSPEGNRNAVAEHALGMLLMLFNKMKQGDNEVRAGQWNREKNRGIELDGLTIGLIGYGNTGQRFARKLSGFDVSVLAYDKYVSNFPDTNAESVSLAEIQSRADVISFHVPETSETRYMFNSSFVKGCNKPFFLINTSRGKVVETAALVNGLKSEKVRGACLDVLEFESKSFSNFTEMEIPEDFKYLAKSANTILTPHVAGWTQESHVKLATSLFEKVVAKFE